MIHIKQKQNCCGCGACAQICPKGCITMQVDGEGFHYPSVNMAKCVRCGLCEKVCPVLLSADTPKRDPLQVYAAMAKDNQIRKVSSSGGVFSLAAQWILDYGGAVFGAAFAEDFSVHHIKIEHGDDLYKLRGSKYVQSASKHTYQEAKAILEQGRPVLYSGTGCQIAGLKAYLGQDYEQLYTLDVLCHGVPSPQVWCRYLNEQEKAIAELSFRGKSRGWHGFESNITYVDGSNYCKHHDKDPFMRCFLSNICLRPSCHKCQFREGRAGADLTVGDAWGVERWMPHMDDDKGTSVVLVNTPRGQRLWEAIICQVRTEQINIETVAANNMVYRNSVSPHSNRTRFFCALNNGADMDALLKLTRKPLHRRVLSIGKRIIKKILGM